MERSSEEASMACARQPSPRCGRREEFSTREFEVEKDANGEWIGRTTESSPDLCTPPPYSPAMTIPNEFRAMHEENKKLALFSCRTSFRG